MKKFRSSLAVFALAAASTFTISAGPLDMLARLDENKDGNISVEEVAAGRVALAAEIEAGFLRRFDTVPKGADRGDGIISVEESTTFFEDRAAAWLEDLLARFDTNHDGAISRDDGHRGHKGEALRRFRNLDANHDAVISHEELVAAAETMAERELAHFLDIYDSIPEGATEGDAIITWEESMAVSRREADHVIEGLLARFDLNKDGQISASEIATVGGKRPGRPIHPRGGRH